MKILKDEEKIMKTHIGQDRNEVVQSSGISLLVLNVSRPLSYPSRVN